MDDCDDGGAAIGDSRSERKKRTQKKKGTENRVCGNGVPQSARHFFVASQLHSDERCDHETGRHQPDPHHSNDLTRRNVQNCVVSRRKGKIL